MVESNAPLISVVVPAHNEEQVLPVFHARLSAVMGTLPYRWEVIFVNDGSTDGTHSILNDLRDACGQVAVVELSRNFGKEIALTAGLDHAHGDAAVIIDADLQDPPELIPALIDAWQEGYDNVYAKRASRKGDTRAKKATAHLFYRLMQRIGRVSIPEDTGDFRLLSRRALNALTQLREQHRFMKGLFAWIGFPHKAVSYERQPRHAGRTKWSYWKLWNLAIEGFTSFTVAPLKLASYMGLLVAALSFTYGVFIVYQTLVYGNPVAGYPSLMVTVLFLSGIQLMALGLIGEYLGRIFNESKGRPLYFVQDYKAPRDADADTSTR